ncbi:MAG: insulinase family protein [Treponema sp.]|nr:insulinase family protein [Treponema sp.]
MKNKKIMEQFDFLGEFEIPDYHSTAVHVRHKKTGLEVFHMLNDDEENLFSFAFRTPNIKANGAAHILEHSVLCGSELYPLKDPFVNLSNQSVKTYLNAMTYSDKTVFPASTISKTDYFNLMRVYADAVFFPRLDKEIFMQEAHRLELDENGEVSIQGVVYNEMKGSYSDFDSVASDANMASLLGGTIYEKDSGGDPLIIPEITHEELCAFHKKWYSPDNCFVFLYGNIPTHEQLEFLQENFLCRLEKKYAGLDVSEEARKKRIEEFRALITPKKMESPREFRCEGPSGEDESGNTVCMNWNLGPSKNADVITETVVLSGILMNHDGSPLKKALIDSALGEDLAPQCGMSGSGYNCIYSMGLRGVKDGDEKKVEECIRTTLEKIVRDGVSQKDIESTLNTLDYMNREIKRSYGPYSLVLMNRPINGWLYGFGVENQIRLRENLRKIKEKISTDKGYLERLIKEKLLENPNCSLVVVTPSTDYAKKRDAEEKRIVERLLSKTTTDDIKRACDELHAFQSKDDDTSCLPHLKPSDFITDGHPLMNRVKGDIGDVSGVPLFTHTENTNGIVYFDVGFPCDVLSAADFPLLPLFTDSVMDCGWKGMDWAHVAEECAIQLGHCSVTLLDVAVPNTERSRKIRENYPWCGRSWCVFRISMLEEKIEDALSILRHYLNDVDFSDTKRLSDILKETKNYFDSSIIPDGHMFVTSRVLRSSSRNAAIDEVWSGLSQFFTLKRLSQRATEENAADFRRMFDEMKKGGAFLHVTAEKSGMERIKSLLPDFVADCGLSYPGKRNLVKDEELYALTEIPGEGDENPLVEVFTTSSQVGYAAECIEASLYGTKKSISEEVCAHWLSNALLWERIRTIGGAYGAFCDVESFAARFSLTTYRDPTPFASCDVFEECLKDACGIDFGEDEVEKAIMGCYSHYIQPQTPKSRGSVGLTRILYGINDEDREEKVLRLLSMKPSDMKEAFNRLVSTMGNEARKRVVLCGKNVPESNLTRKIIAMPL